MPSPRRDDIQLTRDDVQTLSSVDRLAEFFARLRYPGDARLEMTPEALQLPQRLRDVTRGIERLTRVEGGALDVYLFELTSVTVAHTRALARTFRNRAGNFLLVLTDDYERIDFVLLEREVPGLTDKGPTRRGVTVRPRVLSVERRDPGRVALRVLRRFTFTEYDGGGRRNAYAQWEKLKSAYTIAEWSEPLFNNRALFSDYYLKERLPEHPAWEAEDRNQAFRDVRKAFAGARRRFARANGPTMRRELIRPLLETLGFRVDGPAPPGERSSPTESGREGEREVPDFLLYPDGSDAPAAFVLAYPWNRYLDGKDTQDEERPEENPGAQVVTLLEAGAADWGIVTNGKTWRLYSARAHSRATNTYEVNLEETLASPEPGEPFRYFYLFFRSEAFASDPKGFKKPSGSSEPTTFLDWLMEESQTYARELGERLKERVFEEIFPHFAAGFIHSMGGPERLRALPEEEREAALDRVYQGTLTFLYRLLFLLYAESRDLLPVREVRGYYGISLRRLSEEIAEQAGSLEDLVPRRLADAYPLRRPGAVIPSEVEGSREVSRAGHSDRAEDAERPKRVEESPLYDRLLDLFAVIDGGSPARNVPTYNGGLFITDPDADDAGREAEAARFLEETALPDRYLALGLDRLARDVDPKRGDLGFIDYKSLGVRQLGSIYEGLLEFNVEIAKEKDVDRPSSFVIRLISDKGERKATGSYYTPDYIVKYIVRHTVGPVLDEKLDALRPRLHAAEARFRKVVKRKVELEGVTPDEPLLLQNVAGDVLHDLFDVKICDPAMGSGHFLVEAVDTITDRLVRFLDGFPFLGVFFEGMRRSILEEMERQKVTVDPGQLTDVTLLKRHVLKRCIYGVDLNPMAVELAKVSLWLDCFTLGAPLSFLDHHLRCGNSLIGAMAQEVEAEMGSPTPEGQMTFLTGPLTGLLRAAEIMRGISTIADVTLEQVRESGHLFEAFDEAATPYKQLLDVHVARHFGVERAQEFLTLYGAEAMEAQPEDLGKPYREVVQETRELYDEKRFFHWDLEFPEVFIDLERAAWKKDGGFDAVVGNPPYVNIIAQKDLSSYLKTKYPQVFTGKNDLLYYFIYQSVQLQRRRGFGSLIVARYFMENYEAAKLRAFILGSATIEVLLDFAQAPVFPDASVNTCIFVLRKEPSPRDRESNTVVVHQLSSSTVSKRLKDALGERGRTHMPDTKPYRIPQGFFGPDKWVFVLPEELRLLDRIEEENQLTLGDLCQIDKGVQTGKDAVFVVSEEQALDLRLEKRILRPWLKNGEIQRYVHQQTEQYVILATPKAMPQPSAYPRVFSYLSKHRHELIDRARVEEWFHWRKGDERYTVDWDAVKIVTPYKSDHNRFAIDTSGAYSSQDVVVIVPEDDVVSIPYLLCLLNSSVLNYFFTHKGKRLGGVLEYYPKQIAPLPIRSIYFTTPQGERESMVADLIAYHRRDEHRALLTEIDALLPKNERNEFVAFQSGATGAEERSDVVHDLLAHLAEQMMTMHEEKQERIEAFWDDLEGACESVSTFEDLHEHGKWEQSLWKDPACRPYVDRESRSTRHLDESLGWDEGCYEAFAGMLTGRTSVTRPMVDVYRKHDEPYRALVERIEATDELIDQIVYRLYGLTEEEIAVVEGREP